MSELRLPERLRDVFVPEERAAEERGWQVVHGAFEARHPVHLRPRVNRLAIALAVALLVAAVALSPAGAKMADLVRDVVEPGAENAQPALTSLPASGRLLVTSPEGPWIVDQDGSQRLLGAYRDAGWSPSGLFAVAARRRQLTAVDPVGTVRWSLAARRPVSAPAWSPSGIRVAYLSGSSLRVVAGDGTGDRLLVDRVAAAAPAWKPLSEPVPAGQVAIGPRTNVLAYADRRGRVTVRDVDADRVLWRSHPYSLPIRELEWSPDRRRLLVRTASFAQFLDGSGRAISRVPWPTLGARIAPDSTQTAFIRRARGGRSAVLITRRHGSDPPRRVLSRQGRLTDPTWSPDGRWLLVARPGADQWLFIRPSGRVRVETVGNISRQFAPGASGQLQFPAISGWCCAGR
jgi:WD40 repeat protein